MLQGSVATYAWQWQGQDLTITTETVGAGPPILLLPAFSTVSTRGELMRLAGQLAPHFRATTLDWPGFGESDRPKLLYQPALYYQFLQDFVRDTFTTPIPVVACGSCCWVCPRLPRGLVPHDFSGPNLARAASCDGGSPIASVTVSEHWSTLPSLVKPFTG